MNNITISDIAKALNKKGYAFFENDKKPFNINIVGIRNPEPKPNVFNDLLTVSWKYQGRWSMIQMNFTSDPGNHWMEHPMNRKGAAIVKEGQYRGVWSMGMHRGQYKALVQRKDITVHRDNNKDLKHDFVNEESGIFGINCHRASAKRKSVEVNKWSAGCQVVQDPHEFDVLMRICEESAEVFGNSFTYTLINGNDIV